jgi:hypothetical protein
VRGRFPAFEASRNTHRTVPLNPTPTMGRDASYPHNTTRCRKVAREWPIVFSRFDEFDSAWPCSYDKPPNITHNGVHRAVPDFRQQTVDPAFPVSVAQSQRSTQQELCPGTFGHASNLFTRFLTCVNQAYRLLGNRRGTLSDQSCKIYCSLRACPAL